MRAAFFGHRIVELADRYNLETIVHYKNTAHGYATAKAIAYRAHYLCRKRSASLVLVCLRETEAD